MRGRLLMIWEGARSSFWFVPTLMAALAVGLALGTLALDEVVRFTVVRGLEWVYIGGPEGARGLLSTAAGSLISVAGITFSIAIAALALASSQYGPRLLRNFMRDTGNQVVLGTFVATFLYCLLILRTVRAASGDGARHIEEFVPYLSVTVALGLTIASLGVLIYFIHHVAVSIQAATIIAEVGRELDAAVDHLFPERLGQGPPDPAAEREARASLPDLEREARPIVASDHGHVQVIDTEALLHLAAERDLLLRLEARPGAYLLPGSPLALASPPERVDTGVIEAVKAAMTLGKQRTLTQDVGFGIDQLVEIAARALSPSLNDPFTAIMCVNRLGALLARVAGRRMPSPYRHDEAGRLRVIAHPVTLADLIATAFDPIRQYGRSSVAVMSRLLEVIAIMGGQIEEEAARAALRRQARLIERASHQAVVGEEDRQTIAARYREAMAALGTD